MLKAGVLHRDISDGDIYMQLRTSKDTEETEDLVSQTKGTLIDLDHAKRTVEKLVRTLDPESHFIKIYTDVLRILDLQLTDDAVVKALKSVPSSHLPNYVSAAIQFDIKKSKLGEGRWTAEDLGWDDLEEQWDFDTHVPDANGKRTGTIPFISHRLIKASDELDLHNPIHDMESLFWVIIHICLIRESGFGHREKDPPKEPITLAQPKQSGPPKPEAPEECAKREEREKREKRKQYISRLFFSNEDAIASSKTAHFESEVSIDNLLAHIHDYFSPFRDMLKRWRNVLVLGYTYKAYEYYHVHRYLLKIVEDTMRHPDVLGEAQDTAIIREEIDRRAKEYKFICNILDSQGDTDTGASYSTRSGPHSTAANPAQAPRVGHGPAARLPPTFAATHPHTSLTTPGATSNPLSAFPSSVPTNRPSYVFPPAASSSLNPTTASSATNRPIYPNTATPVSTSTRSPASVPFNQSSNVARGSLIAPPTQASNRSYPSVSTSSPIPNRPPTSFASQDASLSRASNVMPTVPTTPNSNRTSSSRSSAVPGQNETSPKMPVPKKSRKE